MVEMSFWEVMGLVVSGAGTFTPAKTAGLHGSSSLYKTRTCASSSLRNTETCGSCSPRCSSGWEIASPRKGRRPGKRCASCSALPFDSRLLGSLASTVGAVLRKRPVAVAVAGKADSIWGWTIGFQPCFKQVWRWGLLFAVVREAGAGGFPAAPCWSMSGREHASGV